MRMLWLLLFCMGSCFANVMNFEDILHRKFDFQEGYTEVSVFDYHFKITAEQRFSDNMAQVIVFPQQQGTRFHINHVEFRTMTSSEISGPVAKVFGILVFRESNIGAARRVHLMVPVKISRVSDFTVSSDEARIEGNTCFERKLNKLESF